MSTSKSLILNDSHCTLKGGISGVKNINRTKYRQN